MPPVGEGARYAGRGVLIINVPFPSLSSALISQPRFVLVPPQGCGTGAEGCCWASRGRYKAAGGAVSLLFGDKEPTLLSQELCALPAPRGPCPKPGSFGFTTPSGEITRCSFLHCVPFGLSDDFLRLFFFLILSLDFFFIFFSLIMRSRIL